MIAAQISQTHVALKLAQNTHDLGFKKSALLHQNFLVLQSKKILLSMLLSLEEDYPDHAVGAEIILMRPRGDKANAFHIRAQITRQQASGVDAVNQQFFATKVKRGGRAEGFGRPAATRAIGEGAYIAILCNAQRAVLLIFHHKCRPIHSAASLFTTLKILKSERRISTRNSGPSNPPPKGGPRETKNVSV